MEDSVSVTHTQTLPSHPDNSVEQLKSMSVLISESSENNWYMYVGLNIQFEVRFFHPMCHGLVEPHENFFEQSKVKKF